MAEEKKAPAKKAAPKEHINTSFDIMIEAKTKDEALFKLIRQLKYKTNYKFIDESTIVF